MANPGCEITALERGAAGSWRATGQSGFGDGKTLHEEVGVSGTAAEGGWPGLQWRPGVCMHV